MGTMSMQLPDELMHRLDALASATGRSKATLASEAIRDFVERESWQMAETEQALREADAGDFASDGEVDAIAARWGRRAG